jgi:serine/threonine protein kinase
MVDTQVRMLPITPSFPCNDSVLCRAPVYVAFSAAKVLLETIRKDAEEFINLSLPADIQFKHPFPYVQYLRQFHANDCQQKGQLGFQITETFDRDVTNRFLYVAKVTSGPESGTILVKFTTKYSKELHHFCASSGFAPKLFAFEELPGGWFGIAMEYFPSALRIAESPGLVDHGDAWLTKMDEIVEKFHKNGYVHGDLRPPNFIADGERLLLIDFDWGGKEGEATFPDTRILPVLRKDRGDMLIKRHHDTNVLAYTKQEIRKIMGRTLERC